MVGGLPRGWPKTLFLSISIIAPSTLPRPDASATLGLIVGTRIGAGVDFPAKLAVGVTVGRATTIPNSSGLSARIRSVFRGGDINVYAYGRNNPMRFIDPLGLWYIDLGFNIPILTPAAGVSLDFQFTNDCLSVVPGLYVGAPGFQALVVSGQPSPGLQTSLSGGYPRWVGDLSRRAVLFVRCGVQFARCGA